MHVCHDANEAKVENLNRFSGFKRWAVTTLERPIGKNGP